MRLFKAENFTVLNRKKPVLVPGLFLEVLQHFRNPTGIEHRINILTGLLGCTV
jgi:hypothetical protein